MPLDVDDVAEISSAATNTPLIDNIKLPSAVRINRRYFLLSIDERCQSTELVSERSHMSQIVGLLSKNMPSPIGQAAQAQFARRRLQR